MRIIALELAKFLGGRSRMDLVSDEGVRGMAILDRPPGARVSQLVDELLIGQDPRGVAHHWTRLEAANERHDRALSAEIAALDIALWDLRAKLNGEPLWRSLGGLRPKANTHSRLPRTMCAEPKLRSWCEGIARAGIRGIVLEATDDVETDTRTLIALRRLLGAGIERAYMLDANERWSPKDAIRSIAAIERSVDLTWVESPAHRSDFLGLKRIGDSIRGAVCSGGHLTSAADFLPHLHRRSINVVQIDIARVGITAALQIADAAYGFELPIALTASAGNVHAHLAAASPYCASIELSSDTSIRSSVRIENGWAIGGDEPGHGLVLDDALHGGSSS